VETRKASSEAPALLASLQGPQPVVGMYTE
jgi:hypothetical protein